ncbi:MAG TPA: hypothetical protein DCY94_01655 [Firmicutes bacterium]|nr:hypothetical protein [Bacillota bacterium]
MSILKQYSVIRNYKKFKKDYTKFVLFIKGGDYYYTFDADAKIMMFLYDSRNPVLEYRIDKNEFTKVLVKLHSVGLNVVLAGWKLSNEFYTDKTNEYDTIKKKAKEYYKATDGSVHYPY